MGLDIVKMPIYQGAGVAGVEHAPDRLCNGAIERLKRYHPKYNIEEIKVPESNKDDRWKFPRAKYLDDVIKANNNLAMTINNSLKKGNFPLTIGGDHSLGLGSVAGVSAHFHENLAVVWIDAHADFNDIESSPSGNIHGMPLAASAGLGLPELVNIFFNGIKVRPDRIFIIGARDIDPGEKINLEKEGVHVFSTEYFHEKGVMGVVEKVDNMISERGIRNIHLSFDIDVMDPIFAPGTGTPVKNGLSFNETSDLLERLFFTEKIKSMDFVEFNPILDIGGRTEAYCLDLLDRIGAWIRMPTL